MVKNMNGVKKTKVIDAIKIDDAKKYLIFPWEFKDKSVKEIIVSGVLEYVPGKMRGTFMDELYRVLTDDGKISIVVPYWNSAIGIQDFRYSWPPFAEHSFMFFNKEWREINKVETDLKCNFDFTYGYTFDGETAVKNEETKAFHVKHYSNSVILLHLTMTKRR